MQHKNNYTLDWRAFGEAVHLNRRRVGSSQTVLACEIGISRNHLSQIELGHGNPSYIIVMALCRLLTIEPP